MSAKFCHTNDMRVGVCYEKSPDEIDWVKVSMNGIFFDGNFVKSPTIGSLSEYIKNQEGINSTSQNRFYGIGELEVLLENSRLHYSMISIETDQKEIIIEKNSHISYGIVIKEDGKLFKFDSHDFGQAIFNHTSDLVEINSNLHRIYVNKCWLWGQPLPEIINNK